MSQERTDILSDIEEFLSETNMGASYFGKASMGSSELVKRLRRGGRMWPENEAKVRAFMELRRSHERTARTANLAPRAAAPSDENMPEVLVRGNRKAASDFPHASEPS